MQLKNFIWDSLVGAHAHLALGEGGARRYHPDISPFAALREGSADHLRDLAGVVASGDLVLLRDEIPPHQGEWKLETQTPALQMVFPAGVSANLQNGLRQLGAGDIGAMLELTQLVLPGYFRKRSIEMGSFFGIFDGGRLVAMTGERIFPKPFREITAVCTHPDYQRRGYAAKLVEHVACKMREEGSKPFLHTGVANARAIALYRRLGFIETGVVPLNGIRRL